MLACAVAACAHRHDGLTPIPLNQDVPLAFGDQRLLLRIDRQKSYHVRLAPAAGDYAFLSASVCKLDPNQPRIEEGNSRCIDSEVKLDPAGVSETSVGPTSDPKELKFAFLALRVFAQGTSPGPVVLRVETSDEQL